MKLDNLSTESFCFLGPSVGNWIARKLVHLNLKPAEAHLSPLKPTEARWSPLLRGFACPVSSLACPLSRIAHPLAMLKLWLNVCPKPNFGRYQNFSRIHIKYYRIFGHIYQATLPWKWDFVWWDFEIELQESHHNQFMLWSWILGNYKGTKIKYQPKQHERKS